MTEIEAKNIEMVRKYFDGCNAGDRDAIKSTITYDVAHYFLPPNLRPIWGTDQLADHLCEIKRKIDPHWAVDRILARGDEVVAEWSCLWTPAGTTKRLMQRGCEWFGMRGNRIAEIRAYFMHDEHADTELTGFPYGMRGYLASA